VTITMPATALRPIAVAAYNSSNGAIASFSGRGYTRTNTSIKPDLAAPGVDIISCWPGGGYQSLPVPAWLLLLFAAAPHYLCNGVL
jgi:subtilisin family serine protease